MADNTDQQEEIRKCFEEFNSLRGQAIQAYASLERSLCRVFSSLSETTMEVASIIFFKIVNASTLYDILEKLLRNKHGATFNLFWNSFIKTLRQDLSQKRNHIVHWNAWFSSQKGCHFYVLRPHGHEYHANPNVPPPIVATHLAEFIEKCGFFSQLANRFYFYTTPELKSLLEAGYPGRMQAWHDIFLQPIVYPPPSNHPLCLKPQAPGSPRPPSPL